MLLRINWAKWDFTKELIPMSGKWELMLQGGIFTPRSVGGTWIDVFQAGVSYRMPAPGNEYYLAAYASAQRRLSEFYTQNGRVAPAAVWLSFPLGSTGYPEEYQPLLSDYEGGIKVMRSVWGETPIVINFGRNSLNPMIKFQARCMLKNPVYRGEHD